MNNKKVFRNVMKTRLNQLSEQAHRKQSKEIYNNLFSSKKWEAAKAIGITASFGKEIPTFPIIEQAWTEKKQVALPKCDPEKNIMDFRLITSFGQLESGYGGIQEPIDSKTIDITPEELDLIIVPGLIFDYKGYRIGYGGGYFDRFLDGYMGSTLALAFHFQLISYVPADTYDIPIQTIITNKGEYACE